MKKHFQRLVFSLICDVYPRFPVQRALWIVRLYAGKELSKSRLAMLERDASKMLAQGRHLDALRILHCALLLNPCAKTTKQLARQIIAENSKLELSLEKDVGKDRSLDHQIDLKMQRFSWYVMQAVERSGFAKLVPPSF